MRRGFGLTLLAVSLSFPAFASFEVEFNPPTVNFGGGNFVSPDKVCNDGTVLRTKGVQRVERRIEIAPAQIISTGGGNDEFIPADTRVEVVEGMFSTPIQFAYRLQKSCRDAYDKSSYDGGRTCFESGIDFVDLSNPLTYDVRETYFLADSGKQELAWRTVQIDPCY